MGRSRRKKKGRREEKKGEAEDKERAGRGGGNLRGGCSAPLPRVRPCERSHLIFMMSIRKHLRRSRVMPGINSH